MKLQMDFSGHFVGATVFVPQSVAVADLSPVTKREYVRDADGGGGHSVDTGEILRSASGKPLYELPLAVFDGHGRALPVVVRVTSPVDLPQLVPLSVQGLETVEFADFPRSRVTVVCASVVPVGSAAPAAAADSAAAAVDDWGAA